MDCQNILGKDCNIFLFESNQNSFYNRNLLPSNEYSNLFESQIINFHDFRKPANEEGTLYFIIVLYNKTKRLKKFILELY